MNYLLDTHLVVWSITEPGKLPALVRSLFEDLPDPPYYSVISIWEVAIKRSLQRADFTLDPQSLRRTLDESGFRNLPVLCEHAIAISRLPKIHRDPFDRMLVAQAQVEGITLLTVDSVLAQYPCPVRLV